LFCSLDLYAPHCHAAFSFTSDALIYTVSDHLLIKHLIPESAQFFLSDLHAELQAVRKFVSLALSHPVVRAYHDE
jgi:hypothetical protein